MNEKTKLTQQLQNQEDEFFRSYVTDFENNKVSEHALKVASTIRANNRASAIMLHGVMPRSGTNYVGSLIRLHPDLYAYPNELYEVPFLKAIGDLINFRSNFLETYPLGAEKIAPNDFLTIFGTAFLDYLYSFVPEGKRLLIKMPSVRYLNYFFTVFPYEKLIILMRDGRDVVSSTIKTWPEKQFSEVCQEWDLAAKMCLEFSAKNVGESLAFKYEEVLKDPVEFMRTVCQKLDLDINKYPFEAIDDVPLFGSSEIQPEGKVTWNAVKRNRDFNPVGRWKDWTPEMKNIFKEVAGQTLLKLGYEDNLDW